MGGILSIKLAVNGDCRGGLVDSRTETREKRSRNIATWRLGDLETSQQPSPFDKLHDDIVTIAKDSSEK